MIERRRNNQISQNKPKVAQDNISSVISWSDATTPYSRKSIKHDYNEAPKIVVEDPVRPKLVKPKDIKYSRK